MPTKRKLAVLLIKDKQIIISHFYLINIHIFDYPDSRLSGLFTEVPMSPDNRGATVLNISENQFALLFYPCSLNLTDAAPRILYSLTTP